MRWIVLILFLLIPMQSGGAAPPQDPDPGVRKPAKIKDWKAPADQWSGGVRDAAVLPATGERLAPISGPLPLLPVPPCRIVDTRFGAPPFGAPTMNAGETRSIPIAASSCGIPATAQAYSLNFTVVPAGPLSYLSAWPAGQSRPLVSTLNSFEGAIVANAAIVPAGTGGAISVFVTDRTDIVIDINGYFDSTASAVNQLPFYSVAPCRVVDTRAGEGTTGSFGPPVMTAGSTRTFPLPSGRCSLPAAARAYSLNITVVPRGPLSYLSIWPTGQSRPLVSTLNSFQGLIVANAAVVPAGVNGGVDVFVTDTTDVIIDINGYFAQ
jgi:hypothetical protein